MKKHTQRNKHQRFDDVDQIKQRLAQEIPKCGEYQYDYKLQQAIKDKEQYSPQEFTKLFKIDFADLPISRATLKGLKDRNFIKMTEIQRCTIPHALQTRDILGASRTGSGKTLAYLIPLIEQLYINSWSPLDGLGALVILPTRELAMQVFEVFNSITQQHILSVGLLIGGKNLKYEQDHIHEMNVLICTPGRLLQHMEQSPGFDASNLKVLVIDEADTILELGFFEALQAILSYLPSERQTMLFSATLSKSIHQLKSLSLKNPETILLHEQGTNELNNFEAPVKLTQFYMILGIEEKIDVLFSFLKAHLRQKILIFFSTCKQVRFIFETFKLLKIGMPLYELHGRQQQNKRMAIFYHFQEKRKAALFTTNIASRGLDFPKIDWVIQFDCPEDIQTYVHRIGRTARYKAGGSALLFLLESEKKMVEKISQKKLEIKQLYPNASKQLTIKNTIQSIVSSNVDLKYLAQRAFISYMRSVYQAPDPNIFDVKKINANDLAESMGLVQLPVIKFKKVEEENEEQEQIEQKPLKKSKLQKLKEKIDSKKKQMYNEVGDQQNTSEGQEQLNVKHVKTITRKADLSKFEKMKEKDQNQNDKNLLGGFLKKSEKVSQIDIEQKPELVLSKRQLKKVKLDGHFGGRNKIIFTKDGQRITEEEQRRQQLLEGQKKVLEQNLDFTGELMGKLDEHRDEDKIAELKRRKLRRQKRKIQDRDREMEAKGLQNEDEIEEDLSDNND